MLDDYNLRALVVDDLASMRSMMKSQLTSIGVSRVSEAPNAAIVINKMRAEKFDLVLLDYYLGDATDGQQLLELIRNESLIASSALAVMVTGETNYGSVAKVAEHTPDAYLLKPFTADKLYDHLLPVIERKLGIRHPAKKTPGLKPIYDQYDAGHYEAVIALVDAYTEREGPHADTARLKGDALIQMGDYVKALKHYKRLQDFFPGPRSAWHVSRRTSATRKTPSRHWRNLSPKHRTTCTRSTCWQRPMSQPISRRKP